MCQVNSSAAKAMSGLIQLACIQEAKLIEVKAGTTTCLEC